MSIFRRVNDILTANINDLVDRFEDPQKMLRQAVREMEKAIAAAVTAAARSIAAQKLLANEIERHRAEAGRWHNRATAAVAAENDDAARRALSRRREHERLIDALEAEHAAAEAAIARLRQRIDAMRAKRAEAGRVLVLLAARQSVAEMVRTFQGPAACLSSSAFDRFDRLRQRVELAEMEAESWLELADEDRHDWPPGAEAEAAAIEAELLSLKTE